MKLPATEADSCDALTKVVGSGVLFHKIEAADVKPEPFAVRVKVDPPAWAVDGVTLLIVSDGAGVIVKGEPLETAPLELTVTVAVACVAIRLAETEAVN